MSTKSVVLLSGGLDSSVNIFVAAKKTEVLLALTFNYGQKAFENERKAAIAICRQLNLPLRFIDLNWLGEVTQTSLVKGDQQIPSGSEVQIDNYEQSLKTAKAVWVPNRNGVFLNIGAAIAESMGADELIVGFNKEEAETFPDNSSGYIESLNKCFEYSTANHIKVNSYTTEMDKVEIVKFGQSLGVPFSELWPCYYSGEKLCEECESCKRFLRALAVLQKK